MKYTFLVMVKVFRFCAKYVLVLAAVMLFSSTITVGANLFNQNMINELVDDVGQASLSTYFFLALIAYLFVWMLAQFLGMLQAFAYNLFRLKIDVFMQELFMKRSVETPQERFFDTSFCEKYSFVSRNTYKASSFVLKIFSVLFGNLSIIISSITIFAMYEPLLIVYIVAIMFVYSVSTMINTKMQYEFSKKQIKEERIANYLAGLFVGKSSIKEMRIFNFPSYIYEKWRINQNNCMRKQLRVEEKKELYQTIVSIFNLAMRFVGIIVIIWGASKGKYGLGTFVMLLGMADTCAGTMRSLVRNVISGWSDETRYFKDYYDLVFPLSNKEIKTMLQKKTDKNVYLRVGEFNSLELRNVTFRYPNAERNAVNNVSLKINKGEIVSILGYNGSGKTTLSKLICGAYTPSDGLVYVNGRPIRDYDRDDIFKYFGVAPQEYAVFSVRIRDYIGMGSIEKMNDDTAIARAYQKGNMEELINRYEKKDQTIIGKAYDDEGVDFSGGELQKMVISSAYMGDPEVLILDEPTASIDPIKEVEMLNNFRTILSGRTAILISHRIGFARLADRIIMMKDGVVEEMGTHEELIKQNGHYAEMFRVQKELYE